MNNETLLALAEKHLSTCSGILNDFKRSHLDIFKQTGVVHNPEAYKFTRLDSFLKTLDLEATSDEKISIDQFIDPQYTNFLFVDGVLKNTPPQATGLKVTSLEDSLELTKESLNQNESLTNLHHSLLTSGIVIEVEKKAIIEKPIKITHYTTKADVLAPTHIVKVGALAEVAIIEECFSADVGSFSIHETYFQIGEGAQVEHVQLTQVNAKSLIHSSTRTNVAANANYKNIVIHLAGKLNRFNLNLSLNAPGANGESYNLYLTNGSEHSDINTVIEHKAADTTSNQIAKGILDGDSKGVFTGKIHIHPQAQRVASGQINKNLLLSNKAQIHSQPQLEIFADDVKCSHGSTTGQLSDDEVFYFQARGIPADKARTLLAHGFGLEVVLKIKNKVIQKSVENKVMKALKTKFHLGGQA
jgi:Fe-S cluster assembly protein SufD